MKSIIIHDWMLKHPKLNGYKLLIFATIYHFTSLGSGCFMSVKSWLSLLGCSKSQFFKAKNELITSELITSHIRTGALFCTSIDSWSEVCINLADHALTSHSDTLEAQYSWDELMEILNKSDNETTQSDNETGKSDNETGSY